MARTRLSDISLAPDLVIEAYKKDVDRTLLRENLKLTPEERLRKLIELQVFVDEVRRAGRAVTRFDQLIRVLQDTGVEFILVGGIAATAHGSESQEVKPDFEAVDLESVRGK